MPTKQLEPLNKYLEIKEIPLNGAAHAMLARAWGNMNFAQRIQFLQGDDDPNVRASIQEIVHSMKARVSSFRMTIENAGYAISQEGPVWCWENPELDEFSEDFPSESDAILDAYNNFVEGQQEQPSKSMLRPERDA